ncbi:signal recognition particle 19 kDa protein [Folsomia candida]|uniref:Signal recognition particle 19 kDa protein n=1 Tax=Folsomia candida TaxID=158441 RepID=A0A226EFS1_FOLCA|nr:signal recognition particle 19 kDa protein [Folsomia candida]OXA55894.1 Signal recognition particle 19 kDa protein [Folsomia candida]
MDVKATKKHTDKERWICIYPAYLNSKKTRAEGRRIPVAKAVENPNYSEIRDVIAAAGFVVGVENKKYCRERSNEPTVRGRIRVHFRNDDGSVINPKFPSRDSILLHCGEMIPKLKSRTDKSTKSQEHGAGQAGGGKKKNKKK